MCSLWLNGPEWLVAPEDFPSHEVHKSNVEFCEAIDSQPSAVVQSFVKVKEVEEYVPPFDLKYSNSLTVILRIVQRCRKFITNVLPQKFACRTNLGILIYQE